MPEQELKIRVRKFGMFQNLVFRLTEEATGERKSFFYSTDKNVELAELERIANQYNLPFSAKNGRAYPKGKNSQDYLVG